MSSWKATVTQLLKNFPTFFRTQRFITMFTRAYHWSLSWSRWIQSMPHHHTSLKSSFLLPSQNCDTRLKDMKNWETKMYSSYSLFYFILFYVSFLIGLHNKDLINKTNFNNWWQLQRINYLHHDNLWRSHKPGEKPGWIISILCYMY
jgi:hypothetical protein